MYEMQGPHVAQHDADLPIPRLPNSLPGLPPYCKPRAMSGSPDLALPLGSPPRWPAVQVVSEFLLPPAGVRKRFSLTFSRFFCHPQDGDCYPPRLTLIHWLSTAICTAWG